LSGPRAFALIAVAAAIASGTVAPGVTTTATAAPASERLQAASNQVQPRAATSWDDTLYEVGEIAFSSASGFPANPASVAVDSDDDTVYVANSTMGTVEVIAPNQVSGTAGVVISVTSRNVSSIKERGLFGIAVDDDDDTIYVVNRALNPKILWAINGRSLTVDDTVTLPCDQDLHDDDAYRFIAVNSTDDTVYVPCNPPDASPRARLVALNGRNLDDSSRYTNPTDFVGSGITIDPSDDTVYLAGWWSPVTDAAVRALRPGLLTQASAFTSNMDEPQGVAILDDTLYVANLNTNVAMFNLRTGATAAVASTPSEGMDVAPFPARDMIIVPRRAHQVWVISGDGVLRQTITTPSSFKGSSAVVTRSDLVYVGSSESNSGGRVVKVYAPVVPSPPSTIQGTAGYEQVTTSWTPPSFTGNVNSYKVTASPGGASCTAQAPATTCLVSGLTAGTPYTFTVQAANSAGRWGKPSEASAPVTPLAPIPPVYPPSAPRDVTAVPGDKSATVTWTPPTDTGSYPVTNYQVRTSPGGATCLVAAPTLSCTIVGLTNGTAYTFEVRALNGAGWSTWSAASAPVTPEAPLTPSILIVDSRRGTGPDAGRVYANGTTQHLTSTTVQTRRKFAGEVLYQDGVVRPLDAEGNFTWTRRTNKKVYVYFRADGIRSNRVIIAAR
jgi:hypothetical protein